MQQLVLSSLAARVPLEEVKKLAHKIDDWSSPMPDRPGHENAGLAFDGTPLASLRKPESDRGLFFDATVPGTGELGPGFEIKNNTQWPLTISLDQLGPLYYGLVQPGEVFIRDTGAVWFTIKAVVSPDNESHVSDWDCIMPIAAVIGAVVVAAFLSGAAALLAVADSVGAIALTGGVAGGSGVVSLGGIVTEAAVTGGLLRAVAPATAIRILGEIFAKNGGVARYGSYAGPPWPFREERKQFTIIGGPKASLAPDGSNKLLLTEGDPLQIVDHLLATPPKSPVVFQWEQMPGALNAMSMIRHGLMVGLGLDSKATSWDGTQWTPTTMSTTLQAISSAKDGTTWGVSSSSPCRYDVVGRQWITMTVPPGENETGISVSAVAVCSAGEVYAVTGRRPGNGATNIVKWSGNDPAGLSGSWGPMSGSGRFVVSLAATADGTLFGIETYGNVLRRLRNASNWENLAAEGITGKVAQIAAGSATTVWVISDTGHAFRFNAVSKAWDQVTVPEPLASITVSSDGAICAVARSHRVYRYKFCGSA